MTKTITDITARRIDDGDPDPSYLEQEGFEDRLESYRNGEFAFIGIFARANVTVDGVIQTIQSAGLWGIESDSDEQYLKDVESEEISSLAGILESLGFDASVVWSHVPEQYHA